MVGTESEGALQPTGDSSGLSKESIDTRQDPHPEPTSTPLPPPESGIQRVTRHAHEIYEARGGEHGKAIEDWLRAKREIDAEMEQRAAPAPKTGRDSQSA